MDPSQWSSIDVRSGHYGRYGGEKKKGGYLEREGLERP